MCVTRLVAWLLIILPVVGCNKSANTTNRLSVKETLSDKTTQTNPQDSNFDDPFVGLCGTIGKDRITHVHVKNLLAKHGISSSTYGSRVYGTEVRKSKFEAAVKLLEESASDGNPTISIQRDANGVIWVSGDTTQTFNVEFNIHIRELIDTDEIDFEKLVLAIQKHSRNTSLLKNELPYVSRISGCKRKYLDKNGRLQNGYIVEINLANEIESPTATSTESYQIMANFEYVGFMGGVRSGDFPARRK